MNTNLHRIFPACTSDACRSGTRPCPTPTACEVPLDDDPLNLLGSKWADRIAAVVAVAALLAAIFAPLPF